MGWKWVLQVYDCPYPLGDKFCRFPSLNDFQGVRVKVNERSPFHVDDVVGFVLFWCTHVGDVLVVESLKLQSVSIPVYIYIL